MLAEVTFQAEAEMRGQGSIRKFTLTVFVLYLCYKKRALPVQKCSREQNPLSLEQNQEAHFCELTSLYVNVNKN